MRRSIAFAAVLVLVAYGCAEKQAASVRIEFRLCQMEPAEGLTSMVLAGSGETFYLHDEVVISNADINSAFVTTSNDQPIVVLVLTPAGDKRFARATRENVWGRMAILIDDRLLSAPVIRAEISGGKAVLAGNFSEAEAHRIAKGIVGR